jgi:hypothetical protein
MPAKSRQKALRWPLWPAVCGLLRGLCGFWGIEIDDIFVAQKQGVCVRRTKPVLSQIEEEEEEVEEPLDILFDGTEVGNIASVRASNIVRGYMLWSASEWRLGCSRELNGPKVGRKEEGKSG